MGGGNKKKKCNNKKKIKQKKKKSSNTQVRSKSKISSSDASSHSHNNINEPCSNMFPGGIELYPPNHYETTLAKADFHFHSVWSDGKLQAREVIQKGAANGVIYMSLTDHDSMKGVEEAMATAKELDVFVFPGVEVSAEEHGKESIHVLGYFPPGIESSDLENKLELIREARYLRGKNMLSKLSNMGIKLSWDRVLEIAGEAAVGRPHIAQLLVEDGHVPNTREAFNRYLHNDGPAYAEGKHFPPKDAIQMINDAGGISVLAHPWCCKDPINLVPALAKYGLQGLEVYHDTGKVMMYGSLARESSLLMTGGSDFHGIDPSTERDPGDIPFPEKSMDSFLSYAKEAWKKAIEKRIIDIAHKKVIGESVELSVWVEHEEFVKIIAAQVGLIATIYEEGKFYRKVKLDAS